MTDHQYIIRGGFDGRERLRILSEVMGESTRTFLAKSGISKGAKCLDVGCGGGDVTCELARLVGPAGQVTGVDRDETVIEIAREECSQQGFGNVSFEVHDVVEWKPAESFDVIYVRFLLTHLQKPQNLIETLRGHMRPGGMIMVEDIDFQGHFSEPHCPALDRYVDLYTRSVKSRRADPEIGPRLPGLLRDAGFTDLQLSIFHPVALEGGIKHLTCITLETIAETVLRDNLSSEAAFRQTVEELYAFVDDPNTVHGGPRVFQVRGRCPEQV